MRKSVLVSLLLGLGMLSAMPVSFARDWPYAYGNDNVDRYRMGGATYRAENRLANDGLYRLGRENRPLKVRHYRKRVVLKEPTVMQKNAEKTALALQKSNKKKVLAKPPVRKGQNSFLQY